MRTVDPNDHREPLGQRLPEDIFVPLHAIAEVVFFHNVRPPYLNLLISAARKQHGGEPIVHR
ncbi:hypothetical protein D1872_323260 [compost metagenome]